MGDMNYHNVNISAADALAMIRHGRCRQLLVEHDELLKERADNQVILTRVRGVVLALVFDLTGVCFDGAVQSV